MAFESTIVPIEPVQVVINDNVENVRRALDSKTAAYSSVLQGLRTGVAADPSLPFVGTVNNALIRIRLTSSGRNAGRTFLRAKLLERDGCTIIKGWMGVHALVAVTCVVVLLIPTGRHYYSTFLPLLVILVGGGYLYERRLLLRALKNCLNAETRKPEH